MFHCFLFLGNKKRRETIRCLFLQLVPPSNHATKQALYSPRPNGHELQLACPQLRSLAVSLKENKSQKLKSKKTVERERAGTGPAPTTHNPYSRVSKMLFVVKVPIGSAAPVPPLRSLPIHVRCYVIVVLLYQVQLIIRYIVSALD